MAKSFDAPSSVVLEVHSRGGGGFRWVEAYEG